MSVFGLLLREASNNIYTIVIIKVSYFKKTHTKFAYIEIKLYLCTVKLKSEAHYKLLEYYEILRNHRTQ